MICLILSKENGSEVIALIKYLVVNTVVLRYDH